MAAQTPQPDQPTQAPPPPTPPVTPGAPIPKPTVEQPAPPPKAAAPKGSKINKIIIAAIIIVLLVIGVGAAYFYLDQKDLDLELPFFGQKDRIIPTEPPVTDQVDAPAPLTETILSTTGKLNVIKHSKKFSRMASFNEMLLRGEIKFSYGGKITKISYDSSDTEFPLVIELVTLNEDSTEYSTKFTPAQLPNIRAVSVKPGSQSEDITLEDINEGDDVRITETYGLLVERAQEYIAIEVYNK